MKVLSQKEIKRKKKLLINARISVLFFIEPPSSKQTKKRLKMFDTKEIVFVPAQQTLSQHFLINKHNNIKKI